MHRHRPFVFIALAYMAGIMLFERGRAAPEYVALATVIFLLAAFLFRRTRVTFSILLLISFLLLGWLAGYRQWLFPSDHIYFQTRNLSEKQVMVSGNVAGAVRVSTGRMNFEFAIRQIFLDGRWQSCSGLVLVNLFQNLPIDYGRDLVLSGKLHRPFEFSQNPKFSYAEYLRRQGIYFVLSVKKMTKVEIFKTHSGQLVLAYVYKWRNEGSRILNQFFEAEEAALLEAMLLGQRTRISETLKTAFARTGTAHILAISGLNVGIVVAVLFFLLRSLGGPRVMPYGVTMFFIVAYVLITGASASVVRAGAMAIVFLTSFVIERENDPMNSLALAAFLILLFDPNSLFAIGFQLSFLSVLSILLFFQLFMDGWSSLFQKSPNPVFKFFLESNALTLSASLGVTGLIAYYFGNVSLISPLANLVVVPLSSLVIVLGMAVLCCGIFCPFLAPLVAFALSWVLKTMIMITVFLSQWPQVALAVPDMNEQQVGGYYLLVVSLWICVEEVVFLRNSRKKELNSPRRLD